MPGRADMSPAIMVIFRMFPALECVDAGLTPSQYRIMKLAGAGGERSTRLAQRLAVAKPTLTATADGLVAAGYASRATEPGHRRVVRLSLTPAGRAALDGRTRRIAPGSASCWTPPATRKRCSMRSSCSARR
jgi:DNA-binding MarR family transcriptional regulator